MLEAHDFDIGAYVEAFERKHKRSMAEYTTMEMLAYAAAYSPRGATAFDLDLPFDRATGELRDDVFARWLAYDPAERDRHASSAANRGCACAISTAGGATSITSTSASRVVAQRIRDLGLSVRHEEFDDDHRNVGYRYEISLPALAAVLDKE